MGECDKCDPDAALARHLEALERTEAGARAAASSGGTESMPSASSGSAATVVQPTAAQQRVMSGLLSRGRVGGWIVDPSEVRGVGRREGHMRGVRVEGMKGGRGGGRGI